MFRRVACAVVVVFLTLFLAPERSQAETGTLYPIEIFHDGITRKALLYKPAGLIKKKNLPLLIALHGGGGSAEGMMKITELNTTADKKKFLVVYPEGTGNETLSHSFNVWNAGECCTPKGKTAADDIGFISKLISLLVKKYSVNKDRVYATGLSNGAQMAYRLGCGLSDKIAAIAPVAAPGVYESCSPKRAVPLIHFHGLLDPCVSYLGGENSGGCFSEFLKALGIPTTPSYFASPAVPDQIEEWRVMNGCAAEAKTTFEEDGAKCIQYYHCSKKANVSLCVDANQGHGWAGGTKGAVCEDPLSYMCGVWSSIVGPISETFPTNEMIWRFVKGHKL